MSPPHEAGLISLDITTMVSLPLLKKCVRIFEKPIKSFTKISVFEMYLNYVDNDKTSASFWEKWLKHLQIYCKIINSDQPHLAKTGATIFIANQPLGLLNQIVLAAIISKFRSDVKILANFALQPFFGLTDDLIGMEFVDANFNLGENVAAITAIVNWIKNDGALIIFPSDDFGKSIIDKLLSITPIEVIPIYFHEEFKKKAIMPSASDPNDKVKTFLNLYCRNNKQNQIENSLFKSLKAIRTCLKKRGDTIYYSFLD